MQEIDDKFSNDRIFDIIISKIIVKTKKYTKQWQKK